MSKKLDRNIIVEQLNENDLKFAIVELAEHIKIVVTEYGGRILGPFYDENEEGILWINQSFLDSAKFKSFKTEKNWNLGGDRLWLAPEFQYNVKDKNAFDESYFVQKGLDPGNYQLFDADDFSCRLSQDMKLETYNCSGGIKELRLELLVSKIENPLRDLQNYHELMNGVTFAGYEQKVTITDNQRDSLLSQVWNLAQLKPSGHILIPTVTKAEYMDYYEKVDDEHLTINDDHIRIKVDGQKKFKVGFKAIQHFGRAAYLCDLPDRRKCLIIKCFFNNPSALYTNEAVDYPGIHGYSFDIYHDDGRNGSYTELECYGQPVGCLTGRNSATDQFLTWFFLGDESKIKVILKNILGL